MPSFIVLEALDGVGKTTLARNLAAHHGFTLMTTPGKELQPIRSNIIGELGSSETARALFYAATVQAEGEKAERLCHQGQNVVMDRYQASTIAYAKARGVTVNMDQALAAAIPPTLTILLTLDEEERQRRLYKRGVTAEDLETLMPEFRQAVLDELRRRCDIEIDLTGKNALQSLALLWQNIRNYGV